VDGTPQYFYVFGDGSRISRRISEQGGRLQKWLEKLNSFNAK
jgi:hypothetical protein